MDFERSVVLSPRFNGPPESGNGGYVCGVLAAALGGAAEATLRAPPPLGVPLVLDARGDRVELREGDRSIGAAHRARPTVAPPRAPSLGQARAASLGYAGKDTHAFATCFVCGPGRPARDGLELFPGRLPAGDAVACVWTPAADLADDDGRAPIEVVWAALDCPSYWALPRAGALMAVLGRMTAELIGPRPAAGAPHVVVGWPLTSEGRKHGAASALFDAEGALVARAEALWIELRR